MEKTEGYYNHRQRKAIAKNQLKGEKVPVENWVMDSNGEMVKVVTGYTTQYKKLKKKEKYNFSEWFNRVERANNYGNKLNNVVSENNYNKEVQETEAREAKLLADLIANYGLEKGTELHNEHLMKFEEKMTKKYSS